MTADHITRAAEVMIAMSKIKHACGRFIADGHETYDPDCAACVEANSDAPEWTT